jgi:hypothetical protein
VINTTKLYEIVESIRNTADQLVSANKENVLPSIANSFYNDKLVARQAWILREYAVELETVLGGPCYHDKCPDCNSDLDFSSIVCCKSCGYLKKFSPVTVTSFI